MSSEISKTMQSVKRLFFIGIGGINMSALAMACKNKGLTVAGSDRAPSEVTERLKAGGIPVFPSIKRKTFPALTQSSITER